VVQGVGFRPFVFRLATREGLSGRIVNDPQGVTIEVEGELERVERFLTALVGEKPAPARIDSISVGFIDVQGSRGFEIACSERGAERTTLVSPDIATCDDCLAELRDPVNRRRGYPFINCTNCGPRYTIIEDIPYDRSRTSMQRFEMCRDCAREYLDPRDRRFHAEPNACWACGPRVTLRDSSGRPVACSDPIEAASAVLKDGKIVAIKGLGGYHLAADATDDCAVRLLRHRKQREEKPLAIMARDLGSARRLVVIDEEEARLLESPARPIVLLPKRADTPVAESVAPGNRYLGVMLPYTPVHALLFGTGPAALVMTSGNLSEEPIAIDLEDALERLGAIADFYLDHDRDIVSRCDDSVVRFAAGGAVFLRRSRGWAPLGIDIDSSPPSILACGAHLKNTVAVTRRSQVLLSQHIGDLENVAARDFFESTIAHLSAIAEVRPEIVAYDLHPDYLSTRFALSSGIGRKIAVQHHHAHIASCLGEAGIDGPVIGIALDGTGYGGDGTVWGGEVLIATRKSYTRAAHLERVPIPGGEAAIKHVWRMGLACLWSALGDGARRLPLEELVGADRKQIDKVLAAMRSRFNSPVTSSCGRLFDAVSSLCGVRSHARYEGQAALELEMAAAPGGDRKYPVSLTSDDGRIVIGHGQMIQAVVRDVLDGIQAGRVDTGGISAGFHRWLAESLAAAARALRDEHGITTVALSGGCFQNLLLLETLDRLLQTEGFRVLVNRMVPANDGGISFGQAIVAAASLE
jgi:hydrogenase maturation protein HypF